MLGWHIIGAVLRDGTPLPPDGKTLRIDSEPELCWRGYHACPRLLDALIYGSGQTICTTICRVRLGGTIIRDRDKAVASERTILWRVEGDELFRRAARLCALDVVHLWDAPEIVVRYLRTGREKDRTAAKAAALAACWPACRPARAAAEAAVRAAWAAWFAEDAATDAEAAADAAARAAGNTAARAAARAKQNRRLTAMVVAERRRQVS